MKVGVRDLKNKLSHYLNRARNGEQIMVTDRGREIAVIVPVVDGEDRRQLLKLVREGVVRWNGGRPRGIEPPLKLGGKPLSEIVLEDRR